MAVSFYAPDPLSRELDSGNPDRVIAALRAAKHSHLARAKRFSAIRHVLENTDLAQVRNEAALAIADMGYIEGADAIVAQLKRTQTKGSRGTLLYALELLRAKIPADVLIQIILNDSFEARAEALGLLEECIHEYSSDDLKSLKDFASNKTTGRKRQVVAEIIEIIDNHLQNRQI